MKGDEESGRYNDSFEERSVRAGFLRKVYMIVSLQLLLTVSVCAFFVFCEEAQHFVLENTWLFWLAVTVTMFLMLAITCVESIARDTPMNYIVLFIFTLAESFLVGVAACVYAPKQVLLAIAITAGIVVLLTLFAMQTAIDFTVCAGIMCMAVVLLLIFGIVLIFVRLPVMHLVYSFIAVFIFSIILIIDTQMMMGGNHKYTISPEDYVFAALHIYIDIIILFLHILNIIGIIDTMDS